MHNVSNRPKQFQDFNREASCYELGRPSVNPSFERKTLQFGSQRISRLLKLFPKVRELPLQIRNLFVQIREFTFQLGDSLFIRSAAG